MFALRTKSAFSAARLISSPVNSTRFFSISRFVLNSNSNPNTPVKTANSLSEVEGPETLIGPGAKPDTVPTDLEQATGLERLELLGKFDGIDFFDQKPLDASRRGTIADPIVVDSFDDNRFVGCTGYPADSHEVLWLNPTVDQVARCWECGSVYKVNRVTIPQADPHHH
ncbi:cytochrome c oxidase subunit IV [Ascoidea rubescens DSM 1968]|uniref:Cytochrome c oxidase subunit 4, mitochondrial n=1 Tax=Ascoidea rubescens DSM 1968 TaxID=1344418 RepID=A0A1D2VNG0_9ASCO|nr:COX5B-domain-containing protein [Ascoidea rubescens DSM 1968]ODV63129.1 COX5B-domain-containing protein [Ascoidea rubescens DSM 1968]